MSIETFVLEYGERLQYAVFFGLLAVLGALELIAPGRPSTADRWRRWPTNFVLTAINIVVLGALPVTAVGIGIVAGEQGWGLLQQFSLPAWVSLGVALATRSFISYGTHVAMHVVPLFWRVHRVHHSDPMLDISTTVRFHPLEFIIQLVPNVIVIAALGLPAWALMVYELLDAAMNVFIHANVRLPSVVDRRLRLLLVTPDLHRVHHSADLLETNSNYGVTISAWDRLFHTYREEPFLGREGMTLGLKEHGDHAPGVAGLLFLPFRGESPQAALAA